MEYLREHGGTFGTSSHSTNFLAAVHDGDVEEVQTLYQLGSVDINSGDFDKRTALHLASLNGNADMVRFLCVSGADVNVADRWNRRPLDEASDPECIEILLKYGAESGTTDEGSIALLDLFQKYSKIRDGERSLDWHDVQSMLKDFGQEATVREEIITVELSITILIILRLLLKDDEARKLFQTVDTDGNGYISKDEFVYQSELFLKGRPATIILIVGGKPRIKHRKYMCSSNALKGCLLL